MARIAEFVISRPRRILISLGGATLLLTALIPTIDFNDQWTQYFDQRVEFRRDTDQALQHFGMYPIEYSVPAQSSGGISDPEYLANLERLAEFLREQPGVEHVYLVLPFANPRHAHEFRVFEDQPLPDHMGLIAGVIDTTTNFVEHPEVVADRLQRIARAIGGPERLGAATDCGFDTSAGFGRVAEDVVWAKLAAMSAGARLASERLYRSRPHAAER